MFVFSDILKIKLIKISLVREDKEWDCEILQNLKKSNYVTKCIFPAHFMYLSIQFAKHHFMLCLCKLFGLIPSILNTNILCKHEITVFFHYVQESVRKHGRSHTKIIDAVWYKRNNHIFGCVRLLNPSYCFSENA